MRRMPVSLAVEPAPAVLPADAPCDLALRLVVRNDGTAPVEIYPEVAKLSAISSYAGAGITWHVELADAGGAVPIQELRRWYGPPGNPPGPGIPKQYVVTLAPGAEHVAHLAACWIPNAILEPRHLDVRALDPEGMDNIAGPSRIAGHPALAERIAVAGASVLVLQATWSALDAARAKDDFLRGHVVAFVSRPGVYELRIGYSQHSWMGLGAQLAAHGAANLRIG